MKKILLFVLLSIPLNAVDLYLDQFHAMQNHLILRLEQPLDIQESLLVGFNIYEVSDNGVLLKANLMEGVYRRYVDKATNNGLFYSFGLKTGRVEVKNSSNTEREIAVIPFYDIGQKASFNNRWTHVLRLEISYFILYTRYINIDPLLGIQITPFFGFSYNLD